MLSDLRLRNFFRMISTGFHLGNLPEGSEFTIGQKTITTAGTAEPIKTDATPLRAGVLVRLNNYDTGSEKAYVGVNNHVSETTGFLVKQYHPCWLEIDDLSDVWIDVDSNGVGISYMAV